MENDLETQDSQIPEGDGEAPEIPQEGAEPSGNDEVLAKVTKERDYANALLSDLKKSAGVNSVKELKGKLAPKPKEAEEKSEYVTKDELSLISQGYSSDEIDLARKLAGGRSVTEAMKDPTVQAAIAGVRHANKVEGAVPEPSDRVPVVGTKTFGELSPQEKAKNYSNTLDALVNKARQKQRTNT